MIVIVSIAVVLYYIIIT